MSVSLKCVDRAREEAFAERAEGNHVDAKFFERRNDHVLGLACPERVFALKRRHWLHGMRAANGVRTGFRQADEANLAPAGSGHSRHPTTSSIGTTVGSHLAVRMRDKVFQRFSNEQVV